MWRKNDEFIIIDALLLFASVRQTDEVEREQLDTGAIVDAVLARLASNIEAVHGARAAIQVF